MTYQHEWSPTDFAEEPKTLIKNGRRIGVVLLSSLLGRDWFYGLIGRLNKHILGRPIKSVFLLYPANKKYTEAYVYHWYAKTMIF